MADDRVQLLDRVFQLLEHLADVDGALSLSELAQLTDLPMPTIHRLLRSLVGQGYVQQEPSKRYALGPRLIRLGESASRNLGSWVEPALAKLVAEFGETTNMAMLKGDACVYVAQVPSPQSMRMFTEVGRVVMLHCTGVGKALLSTLSDDQVLGILGRTGMPSRTPHTLTEPEAMLKELRLIRDRGYAVDEGEQELGVRCVAVPVPGLPFVGALSVSGPSSRLTLNEVPQIAPVLQDAAGRIATDFRAASPA